MRTVRQSKAYADPPKTKIGAVHGRLLFCSMITICSLVSRLTHVKRVKFKWEKLDHPPYSPNKSSCDFHLFGPLKKHLKGQGFNSDDELKDAVKG